MSKINLQNLFKKFCEKNKFELNSQQIEIIDLVSQFLNQRETFLIRLFKKEKNVFLSIWKSRSRKNNVTKFCI